MSTEDLKVKSRRVIEEGWNKGNLAVFDEICAANVTLHHPTSPQKDRESLKRFCTAARTSYPDLHFTIHDEMAAEGDKVVIRWTYNGTDMGGSVALGTPSSGKHFQVTGISINRFEGGKLVEQWVEADYLGLRKQLLG